MDEPTRLLPPLLPLPDGQYFELRYPRSTRDAMHMAGAAVLRGGDGK
jgi:hypothetical protein